MSAEQNINPQDYELLSAYIDGELSNDERVSFEQRLVKDSFLEHELNSLRSTVSLIHVLEPMTAPRNFILTEAMIKTPKIIPFKPHRRMQPSYLSLVASLMLMLFGVMFMLTEIDTLANLSTGASAPIQSDTASEKIAPPSVASAPTLLSTDEDLQAERALKEPTTLKAGAIEQSEEIPAETNAVMNMQAPSLDSNDAELRQEEFDGDAADMAPDSMFYSSEASSTFEGTIVEGDGYGIGGELPFAEGESFLQDAPQPMAAGGFADTQALDDTIVTGDELPENDNERNDARDEAESDDSSTEIGRIMSLATEEIAPPPLLPQDSQDRGQSTPEQAVTISQIGIGLLIIGLLLLFASIRVIRRNRS